MAVVRFHSAEAWLLMASICGCLLLLGAVQLRLTLETYGVLGHYGVDDTQGRGVGLC